MPVCAVPNDQGVLQLTTTQPDSCAGYVLLTPSEYQQLSSMSGFFLPLTPEQGAQISVAIIGVWIVAFVVRSMRNTLETSTGDS